MKKLKIQNEPQAPRLQMDKKSQRATWISTPTWEGISTPTWDRDRMAEPQPTFNNVI